MEEKSYKFKLKMKTIAFLRGINVSGKRLLPMAELKQLLTKLGATEIVTYIQSGNVVFTQPKSKTKAITPEKLSLAIQQQFSFDVPIAMRNSDQLQALTNNAKVKKLIAHQGDDSKLHVTFLSPQQTIQQLEVLNTTDAGEDTWVEAEGEIVLNCPNGYGNTKLTNTLIERKLKVQATTRNWKTVNEMIRLAQ